RSARRAGDRLYGVADPQKGLARNAFADVARGVEGPAAPGADREVQRQAARFPALVEQRFIRLRGDRSEAVHAAHVVHAVHAAGSGTRARATPIIESRLTRSARRASLQPSVPS